jgi:hypothetical protein
MVISLQTKKTASLNFYNTNPSAEKAMDLHLESFSDLFVKETISILYYRYKPV